MENNINLIQEEGKSFIVLYNVNNINQDDINMIKFNNIKYLTPLFSKNINGDISLWYDITDKVCLQEYINLHMLYSKEINSIINQIIEVVKTLNEYMLKEGSIILETKYIYIDITTFECSFIYIPIERNNKFMLEFRQLVDSFIKNLNKDDEKSIHILHQLKIVLEEKNTGINTIYEIINEYKSIFDNDIIKLEEKILENNTHKDIVIDDEKSKEEENNKNKLIYAAIQIPIIILLITIIKMIAVKNTSIELKVIQIILLICITTISEIVILNRSISKKNKIEKIYNNFLKKKPKLSTKVETKEIYNNKNNINLNNKIKINIENKIPYLINENNVKIPILNTPFIIGSEKNTDLYINNKSINKRHGEIIYKDNQFYLLDKNSKKGTYINNKRLEPEILHILKNNYKICFGNKEFIFRFL